MLAAERPSASALRANMRLQAVGIMSGFVGLEIVGASKGWKRKHVLDYPITSGQ